MISQQLRGMGVKIVEECEDRYTNSHMRCENEWGGSKIVKS